MAALSGVVLVVVVVPVVPVVPDVLVVRVDVPVGAAPVAGGSDAMRNLFRPLGGMREAGSSLTAASASVSPLVVPVVVPVDAAPVVVPVDVVPAVVLVPSVFVVPLPLLHPPGPRPVPDPLCQVDCPLVGTEGTGVGIGVMVGVGIVGAGIVVAGGGAGVFASFGCAPG